MTHPDEERRRADEEEQRRRAERREAAADSAELAAEGATGGCGAIGGRGCGGRSGGSRGSDGCDGPRDLLLLSLHLSALLAVAALLAPRHHGRAFVCALLRGYQRWLSRFTPACPATPSCSAFAVRAVETMGPRRGLGAAAHRVRGCGRPISTQGTTATASTSTSWSG